MAFSRDRRWSQVETNKLAADAEQVNESGSYFGAAAAHVPLFQVEPFVDNVSRLLM